jgi:hypothetical protein
MCPCAAGAIGYTSAHYQFQNKVCHKQAAVVKILWMNLSSSTLMNDNREKVESIT